MFRIAWFVLTLPLLTRTVGGQQCSHQSNLVGEVIIMDEDLQAGCDADTFLLQADTSHERVVLSFTYCTLDDSTVITLATNDDGYQNITITSVNGICVDNYGYDPVFEYYEYYNAPNIIVQHKNVFNDDNFRIWIELTASGWLFYTVADEWYYITLWVLLGLIVVGCLLCGGFFVASACTSSSSSRARRSQQQTNSTVAYSSSGGLGSGVGGVDERLDARQAMELNSLSQYLQHNAQHAPRPEPPKYEELFAAPTAAQSSTAPPPPSFDSSASAQSSTASPPPPFDSASASAQSSTAQQEASSSTQQQQQSSNDTTHDTGAKQQDNLGFDGLV